ncbi:MAG: hypothetical protein N2V78_09130 [Methanophagales archaeon]|nr:hypothetical protein [Methanophagales archaeon]
MKDRNITDLEETVIEAYIKILKLKEELLEASFEELKESWEGGGSVVFFDEEFNSLWLNVNRLKEIVEKFGAVLDMIRGKHMKEEE